MTETEAVPRDAVKEGQRRRARMRFEQIQAKRVRTLVTPEGAALNLKISTFGERFGAFLLDVGIQFIMVFVIAWSISTIARAMSDEGWEIAIALANVLIFFIRNFYFIFFELSRRAATPGKRALGLRVADRKGGRLTANAVIARNFMRELEFFLPLTVLFSLGGQGVGAWIMWLLFFWCAIFVLFPLFNKDKMRIGDLVAGTMVIHAPKVSLLQDVVSVAPATETAGALTFTSEQLEVYGIHELHVLEDVLRQSTSDIKMNVANRIATKIGHTPEPGETDLAFLEAYYAALRRHLEQRMLLGQRKADKFDRG